MTNAYRECPYCGGKGKIEITKYLPSSKMIRIMKKHKLSQLSLAKILGVTQSCVNNWFNPKTSLKGIKSKYFEVLKKKGYA